MTTYSSMRATYQDLCNVSSYMNEYQKTSVDDKYHSLIIPDELVDGWRAGTRGAHHLVTQYQAERLATTPQVGVDANTLLPKQLYDPDNPFGSNPAQLVFSQSHHGNMRLTSTMNNLTHKLAILAGEMSAFSDLEFRVCWDLVQSWVTLGDFTGAAKSFFTAENYATRSRDRLFVDVETTATHPCKGDIIEVGVVLTSAEGKVKDELVRRYDTAAGVAQLAGMVPLQHAHNITPGEIIGEPVLWDTPDTELKELLCDPVNVVVAHNTNFEGQWFSALWKEFWDTRSIFSRAFASSRRPVASFQDTKYLTALCVNTPRNRLKDMVEAHGGTYEGAHRALADTVMTKDAFFKFIDSTTQAGGVLC